MSDKEQQLRQVEKVAASAVLHGSESLCKLLRYLAHHAIEHAGTPLKEYQIATEEFGRPPDFDPAVDSMVRVQAGRLRAKLLEYYANEDTAPPVGFDRWWVFSSFGPFNPSPSSTPAHPPPPPPPQKQTHHPPLSRLSG